MKWFPRLILLVIALGTANAAHGYEVKNCDAVAESDIKAAAKFLDEHMSTVVDLYTFLTEKQRQEIVRKWVNLNIRCSDSEKVREANTTGQAHGGFGNTINTCYYTHVRLGHSQCELVNTIMHEQGHAHGFRMVPGHNDPTTYHYQNDPGFSVVRFCPDFTQVSEVCPMKSHTNQRLQMKLWCRMK
jgi:hypothetical protein